MKKNKKIIEKEAGVSAVIGVILMVAITVAIAATVYVYVSGMIGGPGQQTPTVQFVVDSGDNTLQISTADPDVTWTDIKIKTDNTVWLQCGTTENTTAVTTTLTTILGASGSGAIFESGLSGDVAAGDTFHIIGPGTLDGNVKFTFVYDPTNSVIGTWTVNI